MNAKGALGDLLAKAGVAVREAQGPADGDAASGEVGAGAPASKFSAGAVRPGTGSSAGRAGEGRGPDLSPAGKLVLRRERKGRGGKTVTVLDGLPSKDLADLARALKKALGCGATVEDDSVVLLGDLAERARDWLAAHGARRIVVGN